MMRPARAEIMRKQSGGDDNGGTHRLETGGLHLRNRDGCGDVDGRDGGEGFAAQRMVGTTNGIEATPAVIAPPQGQTSSSASSGNRRTTPASSARRHCL